MHRSSGQDRNPWVSGGTEILQESCSIEKHPGHSEGAQERNRWTQHLGWLTTHGCAEFGVIQRTLTVDHGFDLRHLLGCREGFSTRRDLEEIETSRSQSPVHPAQGRASASSGPESAKCRLVLHRGIQVGVVFRAGLGIPRYVSAKCIAP